MNNAELEAENARLAQEIQRLQALFYGGEYKAGMEKGLEKCEELRAERDGLQDSNNEWEIICDIKTLRIAALERQVNTLTSEAAQLRQLVRGTDISVHYHFIP